MKLTTGVDDFKKLRERDYTYIDKSLFIEDVIETPSDVQLITRPRRFGKTLNMSMLSYFFDQSQDNKHLFKGLQIEEQPCFEECGSRPVIFLSFKELKAGSYKTFLTLCTNMMSSLYQKHAYLETSLSEFDQKAFRLIAGKTGEEGDLMGAITQLMHWLEKHHGKKVLLLIDEYDSPINEAYNSGYYESVITFMRGTLGGAFKGNPALHKGVLTGILRISKESIFSDLNNLRVYTVTDPLFAERFGFLESEVIGLLEEAGRTNQLENVRQWYNGYKIGQAVVYNPWSVISFLDDPRRKCRAYWVNTSGNNLIYQLLIGATADTQRILSSLINGESIETIVQAQATLRDLDGRALWSLLLFSGYLTVEEELERGNRIINRLRIPNEEVRTLYQDIFMDWMDARMGESKVRDMLEALASGDVEIFSRLFTRLVEETLSYYDTTRDASERVYHAFVLGLLANLDYRYHIRSNRESGYGRYDLMMIPKETSDRGVIIEFKVSETPEDLDQDAQTAFDQIAIKNYAAELKAQGVTAYTQMGIAFCGKQVTVIGS